MADETIKKPNPPAPSPEDPAGAAAMTEALAENEDHPIDETAPGGRYKVQDGVDGRGRPVYREVNAYGKPYKKGQNPEELREQFEQRGVV